MLIGASNAFNSIIDLQRSIEEVPQAEGEAFNSIIDLPSKHH